MILNNNPLHYSITTWGLKKCFFSFVFLWATVFPFSHLSRHPVFSYYPPNTHSYTHTLGNWVALLSWYRAPYARSPVVIVVVWLPGSFDVWTHDSAQDPFQVLRSACVCAQVCMSLSMSTCIIQYNNVIRHLLHLCVFPNLCTRVCSCIDLKMYVRDQFYHQKWMWLFLSAVCVRAFSFYFLCDLMLTLHRVICRCFCRHLFKGQFEG